jgi:hypothetical protein
MCTKCTLFTSRTMGPPCLVARFFLPLGFRPAPLASTRAPYCSSLRPSPGRTIHMFCNRTRTVSRIGYPRHRFQVACGFAPVRFDRSKRASLDWFAFDWGKRHPVSCERVHAKNVRNVHNVHGFLPPITLSSAHHTVGIELTRLCYPVPERRPDSAAGMCLSTQSEVHPSDRILRRAYTAHHHTRIPAPSTEQ